MEVALYTLAAALPVTVFFLAVTTGWEVYRLPQVSTLGGALRAGSLAAFLVTFGLYTVVDVWKKLRGTRPIPGIRISAQPIHYPPGEATRQRWRWNGIHQLQLIQVQLTLPDLDPGLRGLRIGHLTDFHLGREGGCEYLRHAVEMLCGAQPELIAVTGDFVNFSKYLDVCFEALADLHAPLGVYAVRGNHDYWVGAGRVEQAIRAQGWTLLDDRTVEIERNGATFRLSGIESPWSRSSKPLDYIPDDARKLEIILSHTPDEFPRLVARHPHLVLSGHTHGGQICLPFFGPAVVPSIYGRKYTAGLFREKESFLYVSKGVGSYPPIRLFCDPEVTVIELV
jgi:predicted MPP superfamily phosphohydrolase